MILDIPTFFEALMPNIFLSYLSRLKKTWHTAWFEPWSLEENFYEASALPSELAGPGLCLGYTINILHIESCNNF